MPKPKPSKAEKQQAQYDRMIADGDYKMAEAFAEDRKLKVK